MPTDPLTGSRYPSATAAPNVAQDIQNAVLDLSDNTIPNFATTTARDSAYTSWVALGNSMRNGLVCTVADKPYLYSGGAWRGLPRSVAGGSTGAITTSAGGDYNITHGLGATPTTARADAYGTDAFAIYAKVNVHTLTSTLIGVRAIDTRTGTPLANYNGTIMWSAEVL